MDEDTKNTESSINNQESIFYHILLMTPDHLFKVRGSLARRALIELMEKGLIKQVKTEKASYYRII